jgi:hypothetical protein
MRYDINKLFLEPGPCEGCSYAQECQTEKMACRAFASYVIKGTFYPDAVRIPSYTLFNQIFDESDEKLLKNYLRQFKDNENDLFD